MKYSYYILIALLFNSYSISLHSQNKTVQFDGVNDFIDLGNSAGDNIRTIELWFKLDQNVNSNLNNFVSLVVRDTPNQHEELLLGFYPNNTGNFAGRLVFSHNQQTIIDKEVMSNSNTWAANTWYHVAGVIDQSQGMSLYVDGIKQLDTDISTLPTINSAYITTVGKWGNANIRFFKGQIDDLKFHSTAIYSNNFTPNCPDSNTLIADRGNWNFNSTSLTIAIDSSNVNNNVTLSGAIKVNESVCNAAVGLNRLSEVEYTIKVFPNPTPNFLWLISEDDVKTNMHYKIISLRGKTLIQENFNSVRTKIDLNTIEPGLYIVSIFYNNRIVESKKILKL